MPKDIDLVYLVLICPNAREDRLLLIMAALMDICDVFKLMSDGYVADVLPTGGS